MPKRGPKRSVRRLFSVPKWLEGPLSGTTRSWARDKFRRLSIEPLEVRRLLTSLSGFVYNDANDDGTMDTGDAGIRNATVKLVGTDDILGAVAMTTTTSSTGAYSFNLGSGTYTITVGDPTGYIGSVASIGSQDTGNTGYDTSLPGSTGNDLYINQITLASGVDGTNNNFGELVAASMAGTVWNDANDDGVKQAGESAISGVTVQARAARTIVRTTFRRAPPPTPKGLTALPACARLLHA